MLWSCASQTFPVHTACIQWYHDFKVSPLGSHASDWAGGWTAGGIMVQFLAGIRKFCLLQSVQTNSGIQPPIQWLLGALFMCVCVCVWGGGGQGVKWWLTSSAEVRNKCSYTSIPPYAFMLRIGTPPLQN
jgi:hypothetical protein